MIERPSPNFAARPAGAVISTLVLHYTNMQDGEAAIKHLCTPEAQVSAHYVVDVDGTVYQLVHPDNTAWHAGFSYWRGQRNINPVSIGIEVVNTGDAFGLVEFPQIQMDAVLGLAQSLCATYKIDKRCVVGHSDIAPSRKIDPGPLFPWDQFVAAGLVPVLPNTAPKVPYLRQGFNAIGYDPDCPIKDCTRAVNLRYCGRGDAIDDDLFRDSLAKATLAMA